MYKNVGPALIRASPILVLQKVVHRRSATTCFSASAAGAAELTDLSSHAQSVGVRLQRLPSPLGM